MWMVPLARPSRCSRIPMRQSGDLVVDKERLRLAVSSFTRLATATDSALEHLSLTRLEDLALKVDDLRVARDVLREMGRTLAQGDDAAWARLREARALLLPTEQPPPVVSAALAPAPSFLATRPDQRSPWVERPAAYPSATAPLVSPPHAARAPLEPVPDLAQTAPLHEARRDAPALPFDGEPRLGIEHYSAVHAARGDASARPRILAWLGWTERELALEERAWRERIKRRPELEVKLAKLAADAMTARRARGPEGGR